MAATDLGVYCPLTRRSRTVTQRVAPKVAFPGRLYWAVDLTFSPTSELRQTSC